MSNPLVTLANMFSGVTPPAPTVAAGNPFQGQPGTPGNIPANTQVPATPGNPTAPLIPVVAATEPASPLAKFDKLWDTDPTKKVVPPEPLLNINPEEIAKAAAQVDFRSSITPELAARMKAGGDDGVAAMMEAMNGMTQNVFAKAATTAASIATEAITKAEKRQLERLPALLKKHNLQGNLAENPIFSNPVVSPLVKTIASQLQVKNPTASEAELTQMATEYFAAIAKAVTDQQESAKPTAKQTAEDKSFDFSNF